MNILFPIILITLPIVYVLLSINFSKRKKYYDITSSEINEIIKWAKENDWEIRDEKKYFVLTKHKNKRLYTLKIFSSGFYFHTGMCFDYFCETYERVKINKKNLSNIVNWSIHRINKKQREYCK